jgi:hypothetical protein
LLNESVKPVSVLTEEEVKKVEYDLQREFVHHSAFSLISSHRTLNTRNLKLVLENDELMAENVRLKKALNNILNTSAVSNPTQYDFMRSTAYKALEETK